MKNTTRLHRHAQDITTVRQRLEQQKAQYEAKMYALQAQGQKDRNEIYEDRRTYVYQKQI